MTVLYDGTHVKVGWKSKDLTNQRFGRLTAICLHHNEGGRWHWMCRCDCKTELVVGANALLMGNTKSCGCLKIETSGDTRRTHGQSDGPLYDTWLNMKSRCFNPKNNHFHLYGKRGITICRGWMNFGNFFRDMGNPPNGMSIDRINNDGNYSCGDCVECMANDWPMNCRWATKEEQANNNRANVILEFNNKSQTISQWAQEIGISYSALSSRILRGWTIEESLTQPTRIWPSKC